MPWRTMDVHEQRVEFVVAAIRKLQSFRSLCDEFGISRPTGYLWLRRYQRQGVELARNTIHRILLRHDLVKPVDQHPAALQRFQRQQPNELWQMDFKGPK